MLIVYHSLFFATDLAAACADLGGVSFIRADTPDDLLQTGPAADGLIISAAFYTAALAATIAAPDAKLRWLQFTSAGTESASLLGVPSGVVVTNASPAWAAGVAEHAVALLLASFRRLPELLTAQSWLHAAQVPHLGSGSV